MHFDASRGHFSCRIATQVENGAILMSGLAMYIYFDHNVLIALNKDRLAGRYDGWNDLLSKLRARSARSVLSAWHMVENSKATHSHERQAYNAMVCELQPCFLSNNSFVKQQELMRFLFKANMWREDSKVREPFHDSVASMWTTYRGPVFIDERFGDYVEYLVANPQTVSAIMSELAKAPKLVRNARQARKKEPKLAENDAAIDWAWILSHLPERDRQGNFVTLPYREAAAQFAANNIADVFKACPAVYADELRFRNALNTDRKIKPSDAADTQHVIVALGYCDNIVTMDGPLREFVVAAQMKCVAVSNVNEL